uniref:PiggyBac transposable element-derived protein domain-containing protein n=1 Tax=Clastoptera arizonana TaxID=38151 RepID=A0A1B6DUS9_9HEMI
MQVYQCKCFSNILWPSEFESNMVTIINKRGQQKEKPLPVVQYNAHMKGVDRGDQMLSYHPCEHKSITWYKKIFVHLMQMLVINSLSLYNMHSRKNKISLYDFRNDLIGALMLMKPEERDVKREQDEETLQGSL